jgi:chaperonin cofactor prefoldin
MGLFWDLYQQSQISSQGDRTATLEQRVERLESETRQVQQLLHALIERLEKRTGTDLDGDGRVAH